jgi:hypothetical protein
MEGTPPPRSASGSRETGSARRKGRRAGAEHAAPAPATAPRPTRAADRRPSSALTSSELQLAQLERTVALAQKGAAAESAARAAAGAALGDARSVEAALRTELAQTDALRCGSRQLANAVALLDAELVGCLGDAERHRVGAAGACSARDEALALAASERAGRSAAAQRFRLEGNGLCAAQGAPRGR